MGKVKFKDITFFFLKCIIYPLDLLLLLLSPFLLYIFAVMTFRVAPIEFLSQFNGYAIAFVLLCVVLYLLARYVSLGKNTLILLGMLVLPFMGDYWEDQFHSFLLFCFSISYQIGIVYAKLNYEFLNFIRNKWGKLFLSILLGMLVAGILAGMGVGSGI